MVFQTPEGTQVTADERFFLIRTADSRVMVEGQEAFEANVMKTFRWWSVEELRKTSEQIFPENMAQLVEPLIQPPPAEPQAISVQGS